MPTDPKLEEMAKEWSKTPREACYHSTSWCDCMIEHLTALLERVREEERNEPMTADHYNNLMRERDSEWVKAVEKVREMGKGRAGYDMLWWNEHGAGLIWACDEILREMVTPEQIQREREEVERKIREGTL